MRVSLAFFLVIAPTPALADPAPPAAATDMKRLVAEGHASLRTMEGNAARLRHMLAEARRASAPSTPCIDGALSRADAAVRAGREQARLASAALAVDNVGEARRELGLLSGQREASRLASHEADACMLIPSSFATNLDETTIRVEVDSRIPPDSVVFAK